MTHFETILKKMCEMVGADYYVDVKPNENDWFMKHEWTYDQQIEFIEWTTEYLYKEKEARNEIMNWPIRNKKSCRKVAYEFVFNWGWKLKDGIKQSQSSE